ncbi:myeloid differentiation primary response protein myd88 [Plakobranchus ocellatus]|uniref:Myeloid differentiation primary response protein myd88 n=1 Tax=Plakobranchus ocellatus TaxID=259542 RepID=A0AAV3ZHL8_9GAST|nr:myeloid differentiation primary response protein myd88 [Plakobranchus ocellatus]
MASYDGQDMNTDIDWWLFLDEKYYSVPLHALRYSATRRIGMFLNLKQVMTDDIIPDFGGLAELVGFDGLEIKNFENESNPGKAVLDEWMRRNDLDPTLGHLCRLLAQLGREDILTECKDLIAKEAKFFLDKPNQFLNNQLPVQEPTVSQGPGSDEVPELLTRDEVSQGPGSDEVPELLTRDEVIEGRRVIYNAFVCFNAYGDSEKDLQFVKELIRRFESPPYNFKLFVPHRDDLAGLAEHVINAAIISQRCHHMIVVLSNNFLESQACAFQSSFAHSLCPGAKSKRLIPVLIEEMNDIPNIMRFMSYCDFTKKVLYDWSWERLAKSISIDLRSEDYQVSSAVQMESFLPPGSIEMSSSFLQVDTLPSPNPSVDSGWGSSIGASQIAVDVFSSSHHQAPSASSDQPSASGDPDGQNRLAPNHRNSVPSMPVGVETEHKNRPTRKSEGTMPPSPSLGYRALKKIKETFSSSEKKK